MKQKQKKYTFTLAFDTDVEKSCYFFDVELKFLMNNF